MIKDTAIIIPVRMQSTRLPNKPLADVRGMPMMIQVGNRALESNIGEVIFACAEKETLECAQKHGFRGILTDPSIPTGSDRVYACMDKIDLECKYIVNLQGDMPLVDPLIIRATVEGIKENSFDVYTAVCEIKDSEDLVNPNVVKVALSKKRALYFSRTPNFPYNSEKHYKHIGIYAYSRASLEKFIHLPQGILEKNESLEQLRGLENGMTYGAHLASSYPQSVDTPEDLKKVNAD